MKRLFSLTFKELNGYFFYYGHLSSAQLDRWQAPTQRSIIDHYPVDRRHTGERSKTMQYKSVFTNSWLVRQRNRSWIKGLGKKSTKEWTRSLLALPFRPGPPNRGPVTPIACIQVSRQNTQKSECTFRRSPIGRSPPPPKKKCLYGLRCELVNMHTKKGEKDKRRRLCTVYMY